MPRSAGSTPARGRRRPATRPRSRLLGSISWPLVVFALLCLFPVAAGVLLLMADGSGGDALGWALVGFFGAGVLALGRMAFNPH